MKLAEVIGQIVSTVKEGGLDNLSLLILQEIGPDQEAAGLPFIAADLVGAGDGDVVLVAVGSAARMCQTTAKAPIDSAVVGIVDSVVHRGSVTYRNS
jgi:ethanolamine utilization protein EutN